MTLRRSLAVLAVTLVCSALGPLAAADLTFDRYHKPEEIAAALQDLARANPAFAKVHVLAKSPGGRDLVLLEIGPETAKAAKTLPAVFVAADMDGTVPLSGEAGPVPGPELSAAKPTCGPTGPGTSWPAAIPDAAARYFAKPLRLDSRQRPAPATTTRTTQADEDGPDDLDGDGLITQMRVKDPEGDWIAVPGDAAPDEEGRLGQGREGRLEALSRGPRQRRRRPVQRGRARRRQPRHRPSPPLQVPRPGRRPLAGQRAGDASPCSSSSTSTARSA
ncbi:MAG: hypothetical protein MZU79_04545 [Anaerotruncus sp.]|nr:hypothetical protein [Anaerotruncus sp.]